MSRLKGSIKATQFTESVIREMTRLNQLYGGVNLVAGFSGFPRARHREGRRVRGCPCRHQSVRGHVGSARAPRSGRARVRPTLRQ